MDNQTVHFEFEKETKNKVRFKEVTTNACEPIIGTLYLDKAFIGKLRSVTITIQKGDCG